MPVPEASPIASLLGFWWRTAVLCCSLAARSDASRFESYGSIVTRLGKDGVRGIGEIGITGAGAVVANAVFNATGRHVRELPTTLDKLL